MKTSIALIGFMGTGKTVVGIILAEKLGKEFVELDALIENRAGKSILDIANWRLRPSERWPAEKIPSLLAVGASF